MKYNVENVIKSLQKAQKEGKVLITEGELISIATPKINDIEDKINRIQKGIEWVDKYKNEYKNKYGGYVTFSKAEYLTEIPRMTFFRWEKEGIITRYKEVFKRYVFSLKELKETLLLIQKRHGK